MQTDRFDRLTNKIVGTGFGKRGTKTDDLFDIAGFPRFRGLLSLPYFLLELILELLIASVIKWEMADGIRPRKWMAVIRLQARAAWLPVALPG